jgi:hypothetical protein
LVSRVSQNLGFQQTSPKAGGIASPTDFWRKMVPPVLNLHSFLRQQFHLLNQQSSQQNSSLHTSQALTTFKSLSSPVSWQTEKLEQAKPFTKWERSSFAKTSHNQDAKPTSTKKLSERVRKFHSQKLLSNSRSTFRMKVLQGTTTVPKSCGSSSRHLQTSRKTQETKKTPCQNSCWFCNLVGWLRKSSSPKWNQLAEPFNGFGMTNFKAISSRKVA